MKINVKKITKDAVVPKFNYDTDAGADLTATSVEVKGDLLIYGTGLAFEIPKGYYMQISPRSSVYKYDLELVNSLGIVDASFRGEVKFIFRKTCDNNIRPNVYNIGDRIGQAIIRKIVPTEYIEVDELAVSERGEGGFGSTGN